jgi:glutathione S-transferase
VVCPDFFETDVIYDFQIGDAIYYESLPVCDFLDEAYPGRKLLPDTPEERVKDKMALTHYDMVIRHLTQP